MSNINSFHLQKQANIVKYFKLGKILSLISFAAWTLGFVASIFLGATISQNLLILLFVTSLLSGLVVGITDVYQWRETRGMMVVILNWLTASTFSLMVSVNELRAIKEAKLVKKTPKTPKTYFDYNKEEQKSLLTGFGNAKMMLFASICLLLFSFVWPGIVPFCMFLIFMASLMAGAQYIKSNQVFTGIVVIGASVLTLGMWPLWQAQRGLKEVTFAIQNPQRKAEYEAKRLK